jgi:hypothetical protein
MFFRMRVHLTVSFLGFVAILLIGCGAKIEPTPTAELPPLPPVFTTVTPTPAPTIPQPRVQQACQDNALFLEDLTIPDGSIIPPGAVLDKRWSIQNSGTCDWGQDYRLLRLGEDSFDGPQALALYPARAGSTAILRVELTAPLAPGDYLSRWQAQSPDGTLFGDVVYILVVVEAPTPTATVTPLISPTPSD